MTGEGFDLISHLALVDRACRTGLIELGLQRISCLLSTSETRRRKASASTRRCLKSRWWLKALRWMRSQILSCHQKRIGFWTYVELPPLQILVVVQTQLQTYVSCAHDIAWQRENVRGPPGGPPRPPNPGGNPPGGNPNPPGGAGPPTPAAGPVNPTGKPLPAGRLIPGPAASVGGAVPAPPGALVPNLAEGSAGGGPSTEQETMCVPRTMVRPRVRFSSDSTSAGAALPGADWAPLVGLRLTRRNSSVSARTRFMCYTQAVSS